MKKVLCCFGWMLAREEREKKKRKKFFSLWRRRRARVRYLCFWAKVGGWTCTLLFSPSVSTASAELQF